MSLVPKTIYMQLPTGDAQYSTWSAERINDDDVVYRRGDWPEPCQVPDEVRDDIAELVDVAAEQTQYAADQAVIDSVRQWLRSLEAEE